MKLFKLQILHGSLARRVFLRAFFFAAVLSVVPLVHILSGSYMRMFNFVNTIDCASEFGGDDVNLDPGKFISQTRLSEPHLGQLRFGEVQARCELDCHCGQRANGDAPFEWRQGSLCW